MTRLISVLLPDPLEPTSAVVDAGRRVEETCFSTGTPGMYSKRHVLERHVAVHARGAARGSSSPRPRSPCADFANAIEPGEGFGQLRADLTQSNHRRGDERR